jgi:hypothetical protein
VAAALVENGKGVEAEIAALIRDRAAPADHLALSIVRDLLTMKE